MQIKTRCKTTAAVNNNSFIKFVLSLSNHGGATRDRTADLLNAIQALSQLSYSPKRIIILPNLKFEVNYYSIKITSPGVRTSKLLIFFCLIAFFKRFGGSNVSSAVSVKVPQCIP